MSFNSARKGNNETEWLTDALAGQIEAGDTFDMQIKHLDNKNSRFGRRAWRVMLEDAESRGLFLANEYETQNGADLTFVLFDFLRAAYGVDTNGELPASHDLVEDPDADFPFLLTDNILEDVKGKWITMEVRKVRQNGEYTNIDWKYAGPAVPPRPQRGGSRRGGGSEPPPHSDDDVF